MKLKALAGAFIALLLVAAPSFAAPKFPPLTGRVVDQANILPASTEAELTAKLQALEASSGHQLVVATIKDLQGYEIEDYGYQLGRTWGIGSKEDDDGALLIVAPNERKVRIEVGYGLEPVLTDAMSSVIIQSQIIPKFRDGDMPGGITAGVDAIIEQLTLPEDQAQALAEQAAEQPANAARGDGRGGGWVGIVVLFILFMVFSSLARGRRRRGRGGMGVLPWIVLGALANSGRRGGGGWSSGDGGGWGGGGGGGFSGGGGSFGGGGASGGW